MAIKNLKNEGLFGGGGFDPAEFRRLNALALKRGWMHMPKPQTTIPRAPLDKKNLNCEDFRTDRIPAATPVPVVPPEAETD